MNLRSDHPTMFALLANIVLEPTKRVVAWLEPSLSTVLIAVQIVVAVATAIWIFSRVRGQRIANAEAEERLRQLKSAGKSILSIFFALALVGCGSLLPSKKTESASSSIAGQVATQQTLSFESLGKTAVSNGVPFRATAAAVTSASDSDNARAQYAITVPMWVNLLGLGVAILVVVFAIKYARKSSAAVDATLGLADSGIASVIRAIRHKNPEDPIIALLEAERGKLLR